MTSSHVFDRRRDWREDGKVVFNDRGVEPHPDSDCESNVQIVAAFLQDDMDCGGHNVNTAKRSMYRRIH